MMELYSLKECERARVRAVRARRAAAGGLIAALAVCVVLCLRVSTLNARAFYLAAVAVSTLGGWAAILIWALGYRPRRAEHIHMKGMLEGPREGSAGTLGCPGGITLIPGSISVRRVPLLSEEGSVSLLIYAPFAKELPSEGARVRVETVSRYIVSWEVIG